MSIKNARRIVVKVGTSTLTYPNGKLNIRQMGELVRVIADITNSGREVALVSSGSIGVGAGKMGIERPDDTAGKQAAAAVGQCELMFMYDKMFSEYGQTVAQMLLTRDITDDSHRKENVVNTFERLLQLQAIPIINENDTVSTEEIVFGDNDHLSAIMAVLINADALILVTDTDGLYDSDPHKNPNARLIERVEKITPEIEALAGGAGSRRGTGGMATKVTAAKLAAEHGITTAIINGERPSSIYDLLDGKSVGTIFAAAEEE